MRAWALSGAVRIRAEADSREAAAARGRAHALRARHRSRPGRVPPPLSLGPADRAGDPAQAVAAAAPPARALRGARLGRLRAADRVRPRRRDPAPDRAPPRAPERLRHAARAALGRVAGGPLARGARRLRPGAEAVDRAGARSPRGGLGPRRPERARARLAAPAGDPEHRQLDARDAGRDGPGPRRPAARARRGLPEVRGPRGAASGRRATEDEVREFFAPYGEYAALAGCYALQLRGCARTARCCLQRGSSHDREAREDGRRVARGARRPTASTSCARRAPSRRSRARTRTRRPTACTAAAPAAPSCSAPTRSSTPAPAGRASPSPPWPTPWSSTRTGASG